MSAMLARISAPGSYEAFQHFITDAPWAAEHVWRRLRATIPDREGVLILDGTSFPKQGTHSVGVARQVLRHARQGRQLPGRRDGGAVDRRPRLDAGRELVSARGVADARGASARPHSGDRLLPGEVAPGAHAAAAGTHQRDHGDGGIGRCRVWRQRHAASHAAPREAAVCVGRVVDADRVSRHPGRDGPGTARRQGAPAHATTLGRGVQSVAVSVLAAEQPAKAWRIITWRNGTNRPWRARFFARRVTPAHDWRERRVAPEVWLLCERDLGSTPRTKSYLVDLPATTSLKALVQLGPSALGDRAAVSRAQGRTRARSLRRPLAVIPPAARGSDRRRPRGAPAGSWRAGRCPPGAPRIPRK